MKQSNALGQIWRLRKKVLVTLASSFAVAIIVSFTLPRPYLIGLPIGVGMFVWAYMSNHPRNRNGEQDVD
jgi:hypothetical protein